MNTTERDPLLYRDGTAQSQRLPKAMTPDYVAVEERTIKDAFEFIQAYAKELKFYDLNDAVTGDWSSFFNQDINDIITFMQDPAAFSGDKEKETQLSQPHLVLLLTFLQLLEHQKTQINTLTKRHLDFYHHQALQMTKKAAIPDQVSVIIQLDSRSGTYELKAGTLFYAGRDSNGNDLLYESQSDTLINHARLSQIKTLYNDKEILTLRDTRLREADVIELMELAVGDPEPGDPLPPYPPGINNLDDIITQWDNTDPETVNQSIEDAIEEVMKESIFIAQERQVNTVFKDVLNTTIIDNLKAALESWDILPHPRWKQNIVKTINNPTKTDFGQVMLNVLYPEDQTGVTMSAEALGRDLLLIMEKSQAVLFDTVLKTVQTVLAADMDEATQISLRDAITAITNGDSILDHLENEERTILKRILNEAIAKADARSNEVSLAETVGAELYAINNNVNNLAVYTQAATQVLGQATKKSLNAAIRTAIDEQARPMQEKIVNDVIEDNENIEDAIDDYNMPEDIANDLITNHTEEIMLEATTGLLIPQTKALISLAVQLNVEQTTLKTIGRQEIAAAAEIALATLSLSQQLIADVAEDIQLGIVEEEVTGMQGNSLIMPLIYPALPSPEEMERRQAVKEIIDTALAKVTQQALNPKEEYELITAVLVAVDTAKVAVINAITTVTDTNVADEALTNTNGTLEEVITIAQDTSESSAADYCHHQLFMEKEELEYVLDYRPVSDDDAWEQCYVILEDAHKDKVIQQGKEVLQYKREEGDKIAEGRGFQNISEYCWGQPGEEDPLPPYPEGANNLDDVNEQWNSNGTTEEDKKEKENASDYIRHELCLNETGFSQIMYVKNAPNATESQWDEVYELMEIARMKNREIRIEEPQKDLYGNFYATPDATQTAFRKEYEDESSNLRWKTFGANPLDRKNNTVTFADIGFAISSSVLAMEKGKRSITWTMSFEQQSYDEGDMELLFGNGNTTPDPEEFPFAFAVTTPKQWVDAAVDHVRYGTCITRDPEKPYDINSVHLSSANVITKSGGTAFTTADAGGFLVWGTNGAICKIDNIVNSNEAKVTPLTETVLLDQRPEAHLVKKYGPEDVWFHALQFELSIDEKEDPVAALEAAADTFQWPVLKMVLCNIRRSSGIQGIPDYYINAYNQVEHLKLEKACVKVNVAALNEFTLGNDEETLNSASPFNPFGDNPEPGAAFYFAHPETAYKKLDTLHIDMEWMGAPDDFKTHYENYWRADGIVDYPYMDNAGYTAQLKFIDRSLAVPLENLDYTETFRVMEGSTEEAFLLSGTPLNMVTTADFKVETEDGFELSIVDYHPDVKSQYIVISTEGRSIGDSFTVTYENTTPVSEEETFLNAEVQFPILKTEEESLPLKVHKIGDRITFYLKDGMDGDKLKHIKDNQVEWYDDKFTPIQASGEYDAPEIVIETSVYPDTLIKVTYPAADSPYLFSSPDAANTHTLGIRNMSEILAESNSSYEYTRDNSLYTEDDVREWARFWEMRLNAPGFYHADYNRLLSKEQLKIEADASAERLLLNPPYTPKIKKMTFAYTALAMVETETYLSGGSDDLLLYVHPFGYGEIQPSELTNDTQETEEEPYYYFFPEYKDEGELYLGFEAFTPPNDLSVLFQMAEGSADPDLPVAEVQWSYLSNNCWISLGEENIPYDATNGLVNTGIITFELPEDATNNDTTLPGGLHWLKAAVELNTAAVCDTIGIQAQAINVVLTNPDEVPPDHLTELLPGQSITKTSEKIEEIEQVEQPYTSNKGKPEEQDANFYVRIGERIRHKNRLLTLWDYERIVLEEFPDVYKAKSLFTNSKTNTEGELGKVELIVIPDIKGKLPFNPFEPKVPAGQLLDIRQYLNNYLPEAVALVVRNAVFTPIKLRFAVRFREGYNEGVYAAQLNEDLKQYLSPWAYDQEAEISFGSKIYSNTIIDFLEGRPYVDYITRIKIFQAVHDENGDVKYEDVRLLQNGENVAVATMPDEILMSAMEHEIDVITAGRYDDDIYRGINYMKIELDFIVEFKT